MFKYKIISEPKIKVTIGLPTMESHSYIYDSLKRIQNEMILIPAEIDTRLIVCLNGTNDNNSTINEIIRFFNDNPHIKNTILVLNETGKNKAINSIVNLSKAEEVDIVHLLDDDVCLSAGSLNTNISALLSMENRNGLVGSHFVAKKISLLNIYHENGNFLKSVSLWLKHQVFSQPFRTEYLKYAPDFCSGQSLGMWVNSAPIIPDDSTGIADDGYLSNYFALNGSIIKPVNSKVMFLTPESFKEWTRQQIRTSHGILKGFSIFSPTEQLELKKHFSWHFAYNPESLRKPTFKMTINPFYWTHRLLKNWVYQKSVQLDQDNKTINWATAETSKKVSKL